ncbi:MAG: hypothetical protein ABJM43_20415 [Paracoccaceae bacterium]
MNKKQLLTLCGWLSLSIVLTGCENLEDRVVFAQAHTVGISVSQSQTAPTPEFVVGYKDTNVALLPTVARDSSGKTTTLGGVSKNQGSEFNETFSVFGQFQANAASKQAGSPDVSLGKFFATGLAAQKLAAGFACSVAVGKDSAHCHKP